MNSLGSRLLQWITNESITAALSFTPRLGCTGSPGGSHPDPGASTLCPMPASNCSPKAPWCHLGCSGWGEQCREKGNQTGHCRWITGPGHSHQPWASECPAWTPQGQDAAWATSCHLFQGIPALLPIWWYYQSQTHPLSPITAASSSAHALWSTPENARVPWWFGLFLSVLWGSMSLMNTERCCWRREKAKRSTFICKEFAPCVSP